MQDKPVYTIARLTTKVMFERPVTGVVSMVDAAGDILFWESRDQADHACAEQNDKSDGWWIVVPRMVRSIRDDVD